MVSVHGIVTQGNSMKIGDCNLFSLFQTKLIQANMTFTPLKLTAEVNIQMLYTVKETHLEGS